MDSSQRLIQFPCKCGHRFALSRDMAAGVIQCPRCGLLNDVPTLSDLESIADDGTLLMAPSQRTVEADRLAELNRFYNRSHVDRLGQEKDLRLSHADLADVGADLTPIDLRDQGRKAAPKYDPVTGELIREIEVGAAPAKFAAGEELAPHEIPVARRAVSYHPAQRTLTQQSWRIGVELFMPQNVIVLFFLFFIHILNQVAAFALMGGFFFIAPVVVILSTLIAAHYGNTIEETGPEQMDEVPRPIRGMSFGDDIWRPFCNIAIALGLCYLPAIFLASNAPDRRVAMFGGALLALAGTVVFPAVVLTTVASGAYNNLRPDRVMRLMLGSGWSYAAAVALWVLTLGSYIFAFTGSIFLIVKLGTPAGTYSITQSVMAKGVFVYPMMMGAIFIAHWFCWHLGLIYRHHYDRFSWVLQRHISTRVKEEAQQAAAVRNRRKRPMYVAPRIKGVRDTRPDREPGVDREPDVGRADGK